jgi:hypothetical protein
MSALSDAYNALQAELATLLGSTKLRVESDLSAAVSAGDVVFGPPGFLWEGQCNPDEPTSITYSVYLVENVGERAVERLLDNLPALLVAVGDLGDETTVTACTPGAFPSGTSDLPCYQINAETTL